MTNAAKALADLLELFGCKCGQTDLPLLDWALSEAERYARLELNICEPIYEDKLQKPALNIAAGEYLKAKKALFPEAFEALDLSPAIKRIEVGDTNTEFDASGSTTPEQRFDALTEYLIKSGKSTLEGYRMLKW